MNQQVFISYQSEDENWAARLADTLVAFGVNVWHDHGASNGLRIGELWKPALEQAIDESSEMIVLWSQKLKCDATSVAHQEIHRMQGLVQQAGSQRRFIPVLLDDSSFEKHWALGPYQGEISLKPYYSKAGAAGADTIREVDWYAAVLRILMLFDVSGVVEVPYVVGAMTNAQAKQLQNSPKKWAQDLNAYQAVKALREQTMPFSPAEYGDTPDDWKPFSHLPELEKVAVSELIRQYDYAKRDYELETGRKPKWALVSYSAELLSDDVHARNRARDAMRAKSLVVLDPMSLLHKTVYQNLITNWGLQGRDNVFVIGLAPCAYQMHPAFRDLMPKVSNEMTRLLEAAYQRFSKPFWAEDQCVLEVGHHNQFARWLQVAADDVIKAGKSPLRGSMNPGMRLRARSAAPQAPGAGVVLMTGGAGRP